jgi:hypothetical protein
MATILDQNFWEKLTKISESVGLKPEDLLAVMSFESGLSPAAHNRNGDASGLIQFMPDTLKGLGYKGDHNSFRQLDATDQLDYVDKYVHNQAAFSGGSFKSAAQYYVANLWPVALKLPGVKAEDPNTVIIDSNPTTQKYPGVSLRAEANAYRANKGLDLDGDGKITYGDIQRVMANTKKSSLYEGALASLQSGQTYAVNSPKQNAPSPAQNTPAQPPPQDVAWLNKNIENFLSAFSEQQVNEKLIKKATYEKYLPKNEVVIEVKSSDIINSLEFARILCLAIEEEASADASIYTDNKNVEVHCSIHGPEEICKKAILQLSNSISDAFYIATKKIGGIKINTNISKNKSNYQLLDIKLAQSAYRQFHLKFI